MNRKTFSLVTSLAILTSSLSPTWAAGKYFTYNNLDQNLQIKVPVDETKEVEKKIDLPLVTETMPDESVRDKYARIIFIPETSKVGRNQNYGKLRDEEGNEVSLSDIPCKIESRDVVVKGKEYYALKSARWIDAFNYKENGKEVMSVRKADNNESDLEKKNSHKFSGWKFSNKPLQYSVNTLAINLKDHSINNPVIIRSKFHSRPFFYYIGNRPKFDPDDYRLTNGSEYLDITFQVDSNGLKGNCMLKLSNTQREYAFEDAYNSDNIIYLTLRKKPGIYTFKDYKPEATSNENTSFWYWDIRNPFVPTGKEVADDLDIGLEKNTIAFKGIFVARYIDKYLGAQEDFDFIKNPIPKGCYKLKLEAEEGYSLTGIPFNIYAVRAGISLNEVEDINSEFKLQDENGEIYQGKVAWYDGYKKVNNPSEFKINSDTVITARPVKDYESEKFTAQVKKIEVKKDEDVTLEKLKAGIVNLPKNLDKIEIKTYPDTSEVGEGKATLKLIFTDTSSKEVEVPVKVIEKISGGEITPIPTINDSDIIKEEVPYNGQINLLDNIKNLPDGAEVEDISDPIDTKVPGTYKGKVKVTFKDGSSRIVEVPVEVSKSLADSYEAQVKKIEVNKDEDVTLEKLKTGIVNLPEDIKDIEIVENVDTSKIGKGKATLKLIFTDTSNKEVVVPVKVINIIDAGIVTPVPEIKVDDIIKEEVPYNGQINLLDNIKNLPDGAKVEDISDTINTKISGTYTGKVKVIFKDGLSRIVVIPVEVSEALADSYTPQVKKIEVNKDEDVTLEKLKTGIVNIPKNLDKIEIKTYPDTSEVVEGKAVLKLIFTDTSSKEVVIPVKVINIIDAGIVTPVPEIKAEDIIKEEVPYNGEINLLDNIKNLPDGAKVEDISDPIDTKIPGTYKGKIKVIFKDESSRIVEIPVEVSEALADSYTPQVKKIEVNKDEDVTLEKLKSGIVNLPKNLDKIEIKTYPDTSEVGEGKATLKLIFTDTSSKEVVIPVKVINVIDSGIVIPVPEIKVDDIIKEEVPYNGQINLLDNIKNLSEGVEVEDISDPIDTKVPGTYKGKVRVTFKDGSSRIVEIPIEVLALMAEEFPVRNPVKTQVENLENINPTEKSEIEEKVRKANPQVASIEVDDKGNVTLIYEDGSSNLIKAEDIIILREKTPEEEGPEEKPGEEDNKNPEEKPGAEGDKDSEEKPGEEGDKEPEEKQGEKDNKDPEENPKDNEEEDNKKTENKLDSWNDFPRYYVRNHRTPTYKVETKITYKENKPQVNSKKFVIDTKTGTYTVTEDGKTLERNMEVKPLIKDDRTFLPLRALADILDAKVIWNEGTRTASFTREGLTALIQIDGKKIVLSNGETIELESKALNINGRIYLPLVNVGQVFGLTSGNSLDGEDQDIEWDDKDKTVTINIK